MESLSFRKKILFIFTPFTILFGFLFLIEITVRLKTPYVSKLALFTQENFDWKVKLNHGQQIFEGDALLGWKLENNLKNVNWDFTTFSTNNHGFRYDNEVKNKGDIRFLALGDSVTFGYRVPMARAEDPLNFDSSHLPYPKLIENKLRQDNPDKKIEVIPMAVPGYTTFQGLKWLERDIESLKPDLVTILFGWNDTELHKTSDKNALPNTWSKFFQRNLISKSQALIYANRWAQEKKIKEETQVQQQTGFRVSQEDFISNILSMVKLAEKNNSHAIVIGTVLRDTQTNPQGAWVAQYRSALAQVMRENNIPYLEIGELTETNYPVNLTLFGELIHPNHLGHQLMADKILEFIKEKNYFQINF